MNKWGEEVPLTFVWNLIACLILASEAVAISFLPGLLSLKLAIWLQVLASLVVLRIFAWKAGYRQFEHLLNHTR